MLTKRWVKPAVWGFYMAVVLEFLFMISPFAIHFYSGYGGALNGLLKWPATAWPLDSLSPASA